MEGSQIEEPAQPLSNFWLRESELRFGWKLAAFGGVFLFLTILLTIPALLAEVAGTEAWLAVQLLSVAGASAFCMLAMERASVLDVGVRWSRSAAPALLVGLLLGMLMPVVIVAVELAAGLAGISRMHFNTLHILAGGFAQFTIVSVSEEVLARGYPFLVLQRRFSATVAVLVTAAVFSLMHLGNPGIQWFALLNIFLAGVWLGVARVASGALWLPIGLHLTWNFTIGPLFGLPVSGIVGQSVLLTRNSGPEWITGGMFGPEGGVLASAVLVAGTVLLVLPPLRRWIAPRNDVPQVNEQEG